MGELRTQRTPLGGAQTTWFFVRLWLYGILKFSSDFVLSECVGDFCFKDKNSLFSLLPSGLFK